MARRLRPGDKILASHINRITPDDGEIIVGGPVNPVRRVVADFENTSLGADATFLVEHKADGTHADGSITTVKLASGAVTAAKLAGTIYAGPGSSTTISRSDHTHDTRYYVSSVVDGLIDTINAKLDAHLAEFPDIVRLTDHFNTGSASSGSIGRLNWATAGGTNVNVFSTAGLNGIFRRETGATADTLAALFNKGGGAFHSSTLFDTRFRLRLFTTPADTILRVGGYASSATHSALTNPPTSGFYFEKLAADTNWSVVTQSGGTSTRTATSVPVGTAYRTFRLRRVSDTTIAFSIDGGTEIEHTTNIPVDAITLGTQLINTTAVNKQMDIDWFSLTIGASS